MDYIVKRNRCNCHPETCCCSEYIVVLDGAVVAKGNDEHALRALVSKANWEPSFHGAKTEGV